MIDLNEICIKCGKCCEKTEMELTEKDIRRISRKTRRKTEFKLFYIIDRETGEKKLRNVNGRCIFQDPDLLKCLIYEDRPEGCKFYPLIYDCEKNKCVLDNDCPNKRLFYQNDPDNSTKCKELKNWIFRELLKK